MYIKFYFVSLNFNNLNITFLIRFIYNKFIYSYVFH